MNTPVSHLMRGLGILLLVLAAVPAAGDTEFGLAVVSQDRGLLGGAVVFSGVSEGNLYFGGFGGAVATADLILGEGGAVFGIRPLTFLHLAGRAGLGGGAYRGQAGASWQLGAEVSVAWSGGLVLALTWDRIGDLKNLRSLDRPVGMVGLGLRWRYASIR